MPTALIHALGLTTLMTVVSVVPFALPANAEAAEICASSATYEFGGDISLTTRTVPGTTQTDNCFDTSMLTEIFHDGHLVHASATRLVDLVVHGDDVAPDNIGNFLSDRAPKPFVFNAEDVPEWMPDEAMHVAHNVTTGWSEEAYRFIRQSDTDLLCYWTGYEDFECVQMSGDFPVIMHGGS
ncbi:hypothetical protein [Henriciella litoralis]|uniref:hypothetical protein n=1 Tax=Henriciella litoralis TaxID=568102 RepID=UPI0009FEFAAE|nr:hypothetical protein [Henriciella litoralis]